MSRAEEEELLVSRYTEIGFVAAPTTGDCSFDASTQLSAALKYLMLCIAGSTTV